MVSHEFFIVLSWGRSREVKDINIKIILRCLSAEILAIMRKNWENWKITKSGWVEPLCKWKFDMKWICWRKCLFIKKVQKHIGNRLTMTKQRSTESSCVSGLPTIIWFCHQAGLKKLWQIQGFFSNAAAHLAPKQKRYVQ